MTVAHLQIPQGNLFVAGRWVPAMSGAGREILNPATGGVLTTVADAGPADVDRAVQAARTAFDSGVWPGLSPRARGRILLRVADLLRHEAEEFAELESTDVGKPITFTRNIDVPTAIETFEYYGSLAAGIEGAVRATAFPAMAYTRREPIGVVAAITPFNFPLILSCTKIAAALAAGNTVVHKPAEETPLTALRLAELLQDAGVPDGVFNVVTGGASAGEALVRDARVDKVAFTGSTSTGKRVVAQAGETLKKVTVELGGKGANLIFADADPAAAVHTAMSGFVFNTGQFCMAGTRLLVERPVYADVVDALAQACSQVRVGDPRAPETVVGPMAGPRHLAKVQSFLDTAEDDGIRVIRGAAPSTSDGFFVAPAVLVGAGQESRYVQEEIFGPVLTVQPFDTEQEAVRLANGTSYGLAAGLQTRDVSKAHRVAAALQAGIVWVNGWAMLDVAMPFGGCKQSGYGRENGPEGLDEYLRTKSVVVAL
ncbi:acyl-CoA reductase-like NAD-dependent aldehyde dehydrogenase [Kibdelosporangium banguiense]|uniref:Acyl-CoA reductase-like NAD-dependent aldehyde dehydrogenase n=1 Tax=Kibdelosporangium banguiense TaxID=1365924 RepID=A0ABS4TRS3_9PSEU|nr:aldehyde dehydrogenase family protein [Kibdelosporangium banguiense]MBP2326576.1 acyl-CoA reductase-like NAD-dependent aldehyde dehydrogenase [Kibdelosporangium banguiense]